MTMNKLERDFHGQKFSIETGRVAKLASGSVIVRAGDTMVLVTACMGNERDGDFLPLTMDYVEKAYAAGKIPGGYFRREGKLTDHETLVSRLMDRPCRPLFPETFNRDIQVVATVLSADGINDPDTLAVCGASAALTLSELPFEGPVAAVRVAKLYGKIVINPSVQDYSKLEMSMIVAGTADAICMVEGEAKEVPEKEVLEALFFAHAEIQQLIKMQLELQKTNGRPKVAPKAAVRDEALISSLEKFFTPKLKPAVKIADKLERRDALSKIKEEAKAKFITNPDDEKASEAIAKQISKSYEDMHYKAVRGMAFEDKVRIDGRDFTTVRPISIEVGVLPRSHGSALFQRGETQAIVVTTFGTNDEAQRIETLNGEESKRFMLHYNFPPFSVGETKPMRGPGRREVGHGFLAERAVKAILPEEKAFPYVIRIVSEVTESNGSSSMATVCGSSLALMEAGVPIKAPVAGVAMGLMQEGKQSVVLTDILGDEDHLGDMDFKVCGTEKGITALQMDIKIKGLDQATMSKAMDQAREARIHILKQMTAVISAPKTAMSQYAPKIVTIKINPEKIRDVIGPGGKMIRSITESCGVRIEVTDDGTVNVSSSNSEKIESALVIIRSLTAEAEPGKIYRGIVKRIADFGAFVEIFPGTDGLVHISQLAEARVNRVTDVVNEGDEVFVKCLEVDRQGKIRLSLKDAIAEMAQKAG